MPTVEWTLELKYLTCFRGLIDLCHREREYKKQDWGEQKINIGPDHRWRQNVVRTKQWYVKFSQVGHWCS